MNLGEDIGEGRVRNFFAVDADALIDSFEMRRSVKSSAVMGVAKDGFEKCGSRAFAVSPCDVDGRIFPFGMAETLCQGGDVFEIELGGCSLCRRGKLSPKREQIADRFLEVHFNSSAGRARMR